MRNITLLALVVLTSLTAPHAQAHLMVAQHGTLNIVGDGAFMVLSLPVSALTDVDDDGDGRLSADELRHHHTDIAQAITRSVRLVDAHGARPLEGLMLSLSPSDDAPAAPATQLVVMGRFALGSHDASLRIEVALFGRRADEQRLQITATRAPERQLVMLSRDAPTHALFASAGEVFIDFVSLGAEHIVGGLDHLLFLLVVLAAGWRWRQVVVALTTFTLGHALTLLASVAGGVSVPDVVVEPAIALTIVGMATFDLLAQRRDHGSHPWVRIALVFACALIHGLGLAGALSQLGLDGEHQLVSLAGFNLGIELAQLALALAAALVVLALRRMWSDTSVSQLARLAMIPSIAAMSIGSVWFVQRIVTMA